MSALLESTALSAWPERLLPSVATGGYAEHVARYGPRCRDSPARNAP